MVEKMKKYSFLIYYKTYNEFLESLQQAGVVHIVEKQKGIPNEATDLRKQLATADSLKNTIRSLQRRIDRPLPLPSPQEREPVPACVAANEWHFSANQP